LLCFAKLATLFVAALRGRKAHGLTGRAPTRGRSNKDIARAMDIAVGTVEINLKNIYRKTGTSNRFALYALIRS
jgi:ATP/maltotriose-dependent transcriptional regulator MalT